MINFTVGPVQSSKTVRSIGAEQIPYFRTKEFSDIMFENERLIKKFSQAEKDARVISITGSGTAAMEAAIINSLTSNDKAIVVNGGSFGYRFVQLCKIHNIPISEIIPKIGHTVTDEVLKEYDGKGYTAFILNVHETSTGVYHDIKMISKFCRRHNLFFIVDAISSFLADDFNMKELGVDIMIISSQKALACPPGSSFLVLSPKAIRRVKSNVPKCMYFDLREALKDGERGQTPFTPAVGILLQINARLNEIEEAGGQVYERNRIAMLAKDFRVKIKELPFEITSTSMSNAVTPLHPTTASAYDIVLTLKDEYGIWICPNAGEMKDKIFRVGHIGALTIQDNDILIAAFKDMQKRGLL